MDSETILGESAVAIFLDFFSLWWWVFVPLLLFIFFKRSWLWWRRELWEKRQKYVLLEMILPPEVQKPFTSMEQVFANLWPIYSSIEGLKNFRKKWLLGKKPQYICFEIISVGPHPRFFVRMNKDHKDTVRTSFYSQYPEIEFIETKDIYPQGVSWNLPDQRWDMYGFDEILMKPDYFPIKTYSSFFETKPENIKDEKRIDPINTLLENLNELREGEQIWIQFRLAPVAESDVDFIKKAKVAVNKLVNRKEKSKKGILGELVHTFKGAAPKEDRQEMIPPEMKLTPREREIVLAVENKMGKNVFKTNIRCIYFGEKRSFISGRKSLAEEYFSSFSAPDLNIMKKWPKTKTKIWHFFIKHRLFMRKRKMLRRYLLRETPLYPKNGGTFIMNLEEMATIFHPPIQTAKIPAPIPHVKAKKGEAPDNLPS